MLFIMNLVAMATFFSLIKDTTTEGCISKTVVVFQMCRPNHAFIDFSGKIQLSLLKTFSKCAIIVLNIIATSYRQILLQVCFKYLDTMSLLSVSERPLRDDAIKCFIHYLQHIFVRENSALVGFNKKERL